MRARDAELRRDVAELYEDYVHLLDSGRYDAWLELFADDADYQVVARENVEQELPLATMRCESRAMLADRIAAIHDTQFYVPRVMRRFVSGLHVEAADGANGVRAAEARANFLVTESTQDEPSRVHLVGEYRDRIVEDGGRLRFSRKHCVYDSPLIPTSLIVPV